MNIMNKSLAIGVILLFIGIAVAPSINQSVVKASTDNDLVEVTSQACGIKGYGNTTVKLTRQQYNDLEQYLVEFRARLNQTTTREEAIPIFKEAVVELNKYGLLPKGMNVERAQRLVTGSYFNQQILNKLSTTVYRNQNFQNKSNLLCLIAGSLDGGSFEQPLPRLILTLIINYIGGYLFIIALIVLYYAFTYFIDKLPFSIHSLIFTGDLDWTHGWLITIGLLGIKTCDGYFTGTLPSIFFYELLARGFTGIKLGFNGEYSYQFFMGTALAVSFESAS
jgi:hypothetical protein